MEFCKQFNAKTQDKAGKILPVVITYYVDKSFDFVVKTPPVAIQLLEATKKKSGSAQPNRAKIAEITWEQVKAIAEDKLVDLNCFTVESAMRMVPNMQNIRARHTEIAQDPINTCQMFPIKSWICCYLCLSKMPMCSNL